MGNKRPKDIKVDTKPHVVHAYSHKMMGEDMLVRIQGTYNYIMGSHVVVYLTRENAEKLITELQESLEKHKPAELA